MKTIHICLDADNAEYPQIFPDPKEYSYVSGTTAHHRAKVTQNGDTVTVRQPFGCESLRDIYSITGTIDRQLSEQDLKHFATAWTLCLIAKFRLRGRRHWFKRPFVTLVIREPYLRELFIRMMNSPAFPKKHILKPNLVAPGPVAVEDI